MRRVINVGRPPVVRHMRGEIYGEQRFVVCMANDAVDYEAICTTNYMRVTCPKCREIWKNKCTYWSPTDDRRS